MSAFTPYNIGAVILKNRFIKTITPDFSSGLDGCCSESYSRYLEQFAAGGAGLICTAPAAVQPDYRINQYQLSIASREAADSYKPLIEAIHSYGAKIFLYPDYSNEILTAFITSVIQDDETLQKDAFKNMKAWISSELSACEIERIIDLYCSAISRAKQAGFDGVFINCTLGAFLQTISSPTLNIRTDEWGGDLVGRLKAIRCILSACKDSDMPAMVRWSVKDYGGTGQNLDESLLVCEFLQEYGADALEVSAFSSIESIISLNKDIAHRVSLPIMESTELVDYFRIMFPFAENSFFLKRREEIKLPFEYVWGHANFNVHPVKKRVGIPVSLLGGIRSCQTAEKILSSGICDFISLTRCLVYNPAQCNDFLEGRSAFSSCISCNQCMNRMFFSLRDRSRPYLHRCVLRNRE